jgi:4-aminobutyrate aminotransferase-like enzyme
MDSDSVYKKHKDFLFPCVTSYYEKPPVLVSGNGCMLKDLEGKEYIDFFGGVLTVSLGHAHKAVNAAVKEQIDKLIHTSTLYPNLPIVKLAETLADIVPGGLKKCYFTASGTEADETAVMLAQVYTGRLEIIALRHAYSGRSMLGQTLTAHSTWRAMPSQIASVKHAIAPYCYRCAFGLKYPDCGLKCAKDIEELIQTTTVGKIAGFLAEPIMGVGGFVVPPKDYFKVAVDIIKKYGGVFIADEVQTGFGRTGTKMFGIEHFGVNPDIMTMAKGIANGFPLGATVTRDDIAECIKVLTFSTFGGNPISSVAAITTIKTIVNENICAHVEEVGRILRERLEVVKKRYPKVVGDVRGMGLMQAIEFVVDETKGDRTPNPKITKAFIEEARKRGLLAGKGGLYGNVVRLSPPMTISKTEITEAASMIEDAIKNISA